MTTATHSHLEAIDNLFTTAATPGGFTAEPVEDAAISAAYETARWAPTAFNSSPMRLVLANSAAAREAVVEAASEGNRERLRAAPQVVVVAADLAFTDHLLELNPQWQEVPGFFADETRREALAASQTWLQIGYLITALRGQGLAVGPMTGLNLQALTDGLLAGTSLKAVAVLAVGHADPDKARTRAPRLSAATAITAL